MQALRVDNFSGANTIYCSYWEGLCTCAQKWASKVVTMKMCK